MKIFYFSILALIATSCSTYYGSANFSDESSVYLKPSYRDTIAKATYVSASLNRGFSARDEKTFKNLTFGSFTYHKSHTKKYINYAYGGYAHLGSIKFSESNFSNINNVILENNELTTNNQSVIDGGNYFYAGGGVSGEINLNIPFKGFDWRVIGLKVSFGYEDGSYANLREELIEKTENVENNRSGNEFFFVENIVNANERNTSFNVSLICGYIFKLKNSTNLGCTSSFGLGNQIFTTSNSVYYSKNKITGFLGANTSVQGTIFKGGVVYRLK